MAELTLDTARKILDGAQREALHVARVLAMSLDRAETHSTSTAAKEPSHG